MNPKHVLLAALLVAPGAALAADALEQALIDQGALSTKSQYDPEAFPQLQSRTLERNLGPVEQELVKQGLIPPPGPINRGSAREEQALDPVEKELTKSGLPLLRDRDAG
jgi:hypothetical protein